MSNTPRMNKKCDWAESPTYLFSRLCTAIHDGDRPTERIVRLQLRKLGVLALSFDRDRLSDVMEGRR